MTGETSKFRFVDLFAGIGGFHAALSALGGRCVWASEWDEEAAAVYGQNWGLMPAGDINDFIGDSEVQVPDHDILTGGFPCQPFSKSGRQLGMDEARGTLFHSIARVVQEKHPKMVVLENVRNLAGPRHQHEWAVIIETFRDLGYRISSTPLVVSPHRIRPELGGRPQVRDRIFICATRLPAGVKEDPDHVRPPELTGSMANWDPQGWRLADDLPLEHYEEKSQRQSLELKDTEKRWLAAWNDFVVTMWQQVGEGSLPGFPIWVDSWVPIDGLFVPHDSPKWKADFLRKNSLFYTEYKDVLDDWLLRWDHLVDFPPSRRKFEWQAQRTPTLYETVMHFRPSGIRAKRPTYLPALVAITQTSIIGWEERRISVREAARLQGFPDWFDFGDQGDVESFKQLGNAVCVGSVFNVLRAHALRDLDLLDDHNDLLREILGSPVSPDLLVHDREARDPSSLGEQTMLLDESFLEPPTQSEPQRF